MPHEQKKTFIGLLTSSCRYWLSLVAQMPPVGTAVVVLVAAEDVLCEWEAAWSLWSASAISPARLLARDGQERQGLAQPSLSHGKWA